MLSRREMLASGMVGSLTGRPAEAVDEQAADKDGQRDIQRAIQALESSVRTSFPLSLGYGPIGTLRTAFDQFVRANGKFPDFCEIGLAVFHDVYDWHVHNRQQIVATKQADNRYTIQFMFTILILRPENDQRFVGIPFDKA